MLEVDLTMRRRGFSLDAAFRWQGDVLGVVGANGAGKTTLLNAIAGLTQPQIGRIKLDDQVFFDSQTGIWMPPDKRRLGVAFQDNRLWPHLSARGNLAYGLKLVPRRLQKYSIDRVAEWLSIDGLLDQRVAGLSGGEARRVSVARAVLCHPRMLLFDEPLAGLDGQAAERTIDLIRRVVSEVNVPTLVVSHRHQALHRLCEEVLLVDGGKARKASAAMVWPENNRLALQVVSQHPEDGVTRLAFSDWPEGAANKPPVISTAYRAGLSRGQRITGILSSHQVVLAMAPAETVSMQNKVRGVIRRIDRIQDTQGHAGLVVDTPDASLGGGSVAHCLIEFAPGIHCAAVVTPHAVRAFDLEPGKPVWCLFKATALFVQAGSAATETSSIRPGPSGVYT